MSVNEKAHLVEQGRGEHGLMQCLSAVGLPASTWYARQRRPAPAARDAPMRALICEVVRDHPDYGYRRITSELSERTGRPVNAKQIRRLLSSYQMGLRRALPKRGKSAIEAVLDQFRGSLNLVPPDAETGPALRVLSTDFSELAYANGDRKGQVMAYVDVATKTAIGWAVGARANRDLALKAWEQARMMLAQYGISLDEVTVHSDQDPVYTSYDYLSQLLARDRVRISYSERGAKDNPWIESFWGRLKTEMGSEIAEAATIGELRAVIQTRMTYYNHRRRHSSLGNRRPIEYLHAYLEDAGEVLAKTGS
jgi:putative transposase